MTAPADRQPPDGPEVLRHSLINEAKRHQHRRRQMVAAALVTPIVIGGLIVGLNLSDMGRRGAVVATPSGHSSSKWNTPQAEREKLPTMLPPSKLVVLNPITGDVIEANRSEEPTAAQSAVQSAVAAQFAKIAQAQEQVESARAEAQAAAAQSGHH